MIDRKKIDAVRRVLTRWGVDKWIHLAVSLAVAWLAGLCVAVAAAVADIAVTSAAVALAGAAVACGCSVWKEWYDHRTTGEFSWDDLVADAVGVTLFLGIWFTQLTLHN